jgi:hypothetical protein
MFRTSLNSCRSPIIHHQPSPTRSPKTSTGTARGAEMVGETAKRSKRGPFLPVLLVMLMIFLPTTRCGATTSIFKDNVNATSPYHGRMDEPEYWMFDSEISRMLAGKEPVTGGTGNKNRPAVACSRGKQYESCLPNPNEPSRPENCGPYNRNCQT